MAYFPIKCPYCLQILSNKEVRFDLTRGRDVSKVEIVNTTTTRSVNLQSLANDEPAWTRSIDTFAGSGDWTSGNGNHVENNTVQKDISKDGQSKGYQTYQNILNIFGEDNVVLKWNTDVRNNQPFLVDVPAEQRTDFAGDLLTSLDIKSREGGFEITREYTERFCQCGKELNVYAGVNPSYVILLLGPSNSGKTMFMVALYEVLLTQFGHTIPPKKAGAEKVADLGITVLSGDEGETEDTSLKAMTNKLFGEGILPGTTIALDNQPLTLRIHADYINKKENAALLHIRDMPGEYLTNTSRANELASIVRNFTKFDGFLMMIDPDTFKEGYIFRKAVDGSSDKEKYIGMLHRVLTERILPVIGGRRIEKPVAAVITKGDKFFDPDTRETLHTKDVEQSAMIFSPHQKETFDLSYYEEIDKGCKLILEKLSSNVTDMLNLSFSNVFYSLASSLHRDLQLDVSEVTIDDKKRRKVDNKNAISPWRVTDSFIRLLMQLSIIPPLDKVRIRPTDLETEEDCKARNKKYLDAVNGWGDTHCSGWSPISGKMVIGEATLTRSGKKAKRR